MSNVNQEVIKTDVLVIGGGIAGVFAAIKAKEQHVDVTIADKGTVGKSGLFIIRFCDTGWQGRTECS